MALVPFTYANPFTDQLKLPERLFTIDGRSITIEQAWKGDGKGGTEIGYGASVYPAAYVLAEYLERHAHLVRGKRIIELGTGTGFLGIAIAALGAADVILTDGDETSLQLARQNVSRNASSLRQKSENRADTVCDGDTGHRSYRHNTDLAHTSNERNDRVCGESGVEPGVHVTPLRWGCCSDLEAVKGSFDVIVGSDIAAVPYESAYTDLSDTIATLAKRRKMAEISQPEEDGSTRGSGMSSRVSTDLPENTQRPIAGDIQERQTLVLLAHKKRHISEEVFFETLRQKLSSAYDSTTSGSAGCIVDEKCLGEDEIHPDFRGSNIRINTFLCSWR